MLRGCCSAPRVGQAPGGPLQPTQAQEPPEAGTRHRHVSGQCCHMYGGNPALPHSNQSSTPTHELSAMHRTSERLCAAVCPGPACPLALCCHGHGSHVARPWSSPATVMGHRELRGQAGSSPAEVSAHVLPLWASAGLASRPLCPHECSHASHTLLFLCLLCGAQGFSARRNLALAVAVVSGICPAAWAAPVDSSLSLLLSAQTAQQASHCTQLRSRCRGCSGPGEDTGGVSEPRGPAATEDLQQGSLHVEELSNKAGACGRLSPSATQANRLSALV